MKNELISYKESESIMNTVTGDNVPKNYIGTLFFLCTLLLLLLLGSYLYIKSYKIGILYGPILYLYELKKVVFIFYT